MGAWGIKPWDNDAAADWFMELFDKTKLAQYVEETLNSDIEDNYDEIRAAAFVVTALGRNYIWPDDLHALISLAASRLQEIVDRGYFDEDEPTVLEAKKEIALLMARLPPKT